MEILENYTWPTDPYPLASLSVRMEELRSRLKLPNWAWNEDGLGPASGFGLRAASGRVYFLVELELAIKFHGARGPGVYVDASDLGAFGSESLLAGLLDTLGLSRSDVTEVVDDTAVRKAELLAAEVRRAKSMAEGDNNLAAVRTHLDRADLSR